MLSIVTTMYNSSPYVSEFYSRATASAQQVSSDYEIIFVNDGSPDNSLEVALSIQAKDKHVRVVDLSRNFGHHQAMLAGLKFADGDFIFLIDADLEEEPELLLTFHAALTASDADVVYGVQKHRKGGLFEQVSGRMAYAIFNWACDIQTPGNVVTTRLMNRRYVDALLQYEERTVVFTGLCELAGFKQIPYVITKHMTSKSTYQLGRKVALFVEMITSYSVKPLQIMFLLGFFMFIISLCYACYLAVLRIFMDSPVDGWTSLMVSVWMIGGLQICFLGLIGAYLGKIFVETKRRPRFIVKEVHGE